MRTNGSKPPPKVCPATIVVAGAITDRCELPAGHRGLHYGGKRGDVETWWPNSDRLPFDH